MVRDRVKDLVSIIMPTYNCGDYVIDAVNSVIRQTYKNWELIIVDDGSTDNTLDLLRVIHDERIFVFPLEKNTGRGASRNYAITKCRGEYVAIFDADDRSLHNRLELQTEFLKNNSGISILGGQIIHFYGNTIIRTSHRYKIGSAEIQKKLNRGVMGVAHCSCLFRSECFDDNLYDPNLSVIEDLELFIRLNMKYKMYNLPDNLVYYRHRSTENTINNFLSYRRSHRYSVYLATRKIKNQKYIDWPSWEMTGYTVIYWTYDVLLYYYLKIRELSIVSKNDTARENMLLNDLY